MLRMFIGCKDYHLRKNLIMALIFSLKKESIAYHYIVRVFTVHLYQT